MKNGMELDGLRTLHLFAGAGGGILADLLLGHRPVCAVEIEKYPRSILQQRQEDGHLPRFPIWDDINTFDGKPWRGLVDCVSGGFPCQDISAAGKGAGLAGSRSGLWFEMLRVIEEVQPRFVFAENSPNLRTRGLGTVLEGLAGLGYDVRWGVLGAWHVGANHKRNRMWILANTSVQRSHRQGNIEELEEPGQGELHIVKPGDSEDVANSKGDECPQGAKRSGRSLTGRGRWWQAEPNVDRVDHGVASRVDRIKAIGNGQVPLVAATAWRLLTTGLS
jgi:DNA (cytosine-5)-methyltransferase 1